MGFSSTVAAIVTVAVLVAATRLAEGQPDCIAQLVPCYNDLNTTTPSAGCCNAIRQVVSTQLPCLCNLYRNPPPVGSGINMTQALLLPVHCRISSDTTACDAVSPTGSSPHPPPAGVPRRDGNGASARSWMGTSALFLVTALTFLC